MIKSNKNYDTEDTYGGEYEKLPSVEKEGKVTYTDHLKSKKSLRSSTGHLRNFSTSYKQGDSIELPNVKGASRESMSLTDLELKLKKLKNLSQNDKETIDLQRKKIAQLKAEFGKLSISF